MFGILMTDINIIDSLIQTYMLKKSSVIISNIFTIN